MAETIIGLVCSQCLRFFPRDDVAIRDGDVFCIHCEPAVPQARGCAICGESFARTAMTTRHGNRICKLCESRGLEWPETKPVQCVKCNHVYAKPASIGIDFGVRADRIPYGKGYCTEHVPLISDKTNGLP